MEIVESCNVKFLTSEKFKGVKHGFTLREGGVSKGEFSSLNVGLRRGDNPFDVIKNIELCLDGLDMDKRNLTLTYQTHTSNIAFVGKDDIGRGFIRPWEGGVDGIVTDLENVPLMCYCADCVPILLCSDKLIGVVHSGWRGTEGNIIKNALDVMERNGAQRDNIRAFVGPCIGKCCYEVSEDVAKAFCAFPSCVESKGNGKYMLDLKSIVKMQMINWGVKEENIDIASYCTSCDNDLFFSHRKQMGKSGLLGGFIQRG